MQFIIKKKKKDCYCCYTFYTSKNSEKSTSFHKNINQHNHFQLKRFMSSILNNYFKIHSNRKVLNCYTIPQYYVLLYLLNKCNIKDFQKTS